MSSIIYIRADITRPALIHEIISSESGDRVYPSIFCRFILSGAPLVEISLTSQALYSQYLTAIGTVPRASCFVIALPAALNANKAAEMRTELDAQAAVANKCISTINGSRENAETEKLIRKEVIPAISSDFHFTVTETNELTELFFYGHTRGIAYSAMEQAGRLAVNPAHPLKLARKEFTDGLRKYLV